MAEIEGVEIDLTKLVQRRHPGYDDKYDHWTFCELCYTGGRAWFDPKDKGKQNLFKFAKEGNTDHEERKQRSYRANHTKRAVDTVNQFLFRTKPVRDTQAAPDVIKKFWENVDGNGENITNFVNKLDSQASVFGRIYLVIDRPQKLTNKTVESRSEANESIPYAYTVKPYNCIDKSYDKNGALNWILFAENERNDDLGGEGNTYRRYRLWTRKNWYLIEPEDKSTNETAEAKYVLADQGSHDLGLVPVVEVTDEDKDRWVSASFVDDIVYMDRTLVNYGSLLDQVLYNQTFSQLIIPANSIVPGSKEQKAIVTMSVNSAFTYESVESGDKPSYISPDAAQAALIMSAMADLKRDIYSVTGTDNDANSQSMSKGKSYASGVVREFDHTQIENILLRKARSLERSEEQMMKIILAWMEGGKKVEASWVTYPDKFDIRSLAAELSILAEMNDNEVPEIILRRQVSNMTRKAFPRMNEEEKTELDKILKTWIPAYMAERDFREREIDVKAFTAESQADAMDEDTISGNNDIDDPAQTDANRQTVGKKKINPRLVKGKSATEKSVGDKKITKEKMDKKKDK